MAQSTVKLIVDAQNAIRPLQRVNDQTKALSSNTNKLKGRLDKSNRSLRDTGKSAKQASSGVKTLTGALGPLLKALAVAATARFIFVKTAELETQRKSLEVLTGSLEKTNKIIKELQDFSAVTPFTSSELIEQTKRLKAFGFETNELVDTTRRLSEVAGATGADLQGISTAFGQIRAKGKLQQEENLQLLERGVDITTELKKITGLQGEEFASAMRKGKIGADLVNQALINLTNKGGAFFGGATKQADTLNGQLSTLIDNVDKLAIAIGDFLEPALKKVFKETNKVLGAINRLISSEFQRDISKLRLNLEIPGGTKKDLDNIKSFVDNIPTEGVDLVNIDSFQSQLQGTSTQLQNVASEIQKTRPFGLNDKEIKAFENTQKSILDKIKELEKVRERITNDNKKNEKITNKTEKTTEKNKEIQDQINILIKDNLAKTIAYEQAEMNKVAAIGEFIGSQSDSLALLRAQIEGKGEQVALEQAINNAVKIYGEEYRDIITNYLTTNEELKKQKENIDKSKEAAEKLKEQLKQIGEETRQGLVENLKEAINGSQTLGQALNKVLNNLKNKLLDIALNKAISSIGNILGGGSSSGFTGFLGGLFGKERGGPVSAGGAYVVGERGPEILQMGSKGGNVIPNSQIGGSGSVTNIVNVSVDASGSAVQGNDANAAQLGQTIANVVKEVIIDEQRSGGLLA